MPKRKDQSDDSDSDVSLVDVDFEFFDPAPSDYIALKRLLAQLFQADAALLHTHALAELVLAQPLVGTAVKTDGRESDPYAFLTVLSMRVHKDNPAIAALAAYLLQKSSTASPSPLQDALSSGHVGFVLSERLINMPVQVVPPMYRMLTDEIKWAIDDGEPYVFSHFLFVSRTYRLAPEEEAAMQDVEPASKRAKKAQAAASASQSTTRSFHPEDEQIAQFAIYTLDYEFTNTQPREQDAFGLDVAARLMLVPAERLSALVEALGQTYAPPA